jgi:hypothetical protein
VTNFQRVGGLFFGGSIFGSVGGAASQDYAIGSGAITVEVTAEATRATVTANAITLLPPRLSQTSASVVINGVSFTMSKQALQPCKASSTKLTLRVASRALSRNWFRTELNDYRVRLAGKRVRRQLLRDGQRRSRRFCINAATTANRNTGANATATVSVTNIDGGVVTVLFTGGKASGDSGLRLTDAKGNVHAC